MKKYLSLVFLTSSLFSATIDQNCQNVLEQYTQLQDLIYESLPIDDNFVVSKLPCTISQAGKYSILQNLTYSGTGPAITVSADNVSINFHNNSLTLQNAGAIGILAQNVQEFSLENEVIEGASSQCIQLTNVSKGSISNLYTVNGIHITNSSDIDITYCHLNQGDGISVENSSHISIDSCTFSANGITIQGASKQVLITNSSFRGCVNAIYAASVDGMLIENCKLTGSSISKNLIQLGTSDQNSAANDVLIRNSNLIQEETAPGFDGILLLQGAGCLLESLVVDTATLATGCAIHVSGNYQALIASSSIIKGNNSYALFIENGSEIVFDGCQISEASASNIKILEAESCTIKNCMIFDGYNGVHIDSTTGGGKNSITNNYIYNNKNIGILVDDMRKNSVLNNRVWSNGTGIQIAFSDYTETLFNTSCNNSVENCSNVYPNQQPGDATIIPGSNLCCQD